MYELILSHGRIDLYLFYANLKKDHKTIIEHWVTEGQWSKAIDALNRQVSHFLPAFTILSSRTPWNCTIDFRLSSCGMPQGRQSTHGCEDQLSMLDV